MAGKRLNSPNDVVVKSDGSIWFTDPAYGIETDYEGNKAESEIGACHVYRVDPETGEVDAVITDMVRPNGIAFSPDESLLYVVDTGRTHGPDNPAHMRVFNVDGENNVSGGEVFADCTAGLFDGFRLDTEGRIWTSAADGIHCYHPDGTLIGKVFVPEITANCAFGGPKRNILYTAASRRLRGGSAWALAAASASLRVGVGRPLPPSLAGVVSVSEVSDLLRRNNERPSYDGDGLPRTLPVGRTNLPHRFAFGPRVGP